MQAKRTIALALSVLGVAVATMSGLVPSWEDLAWGWRLTGILAALVTVVAAVLMDRWSGAVSVSVCAVDWVKRVADSGEVEYFVIIPRRRHGRQAPQVNLYEPQPDGSFVEVVSDVETGPDGSVVVAVAEPMNLQIRIS